MEKAVPTVQIDNARARVTEWRFAKGAATGFHRHEYDYVIVPLVDGRVRIVDKEGAESFADMAAGQSYFVVPQTTGRLKLVDGAGKESFAELTSGVSYYRGKGVEHDVINASDGEFVFVEVEIK